LDVLQAADGSIVPSSGYGCLIVETKRFVACPLEMTMETSDCWAETAPLRSAAAWMPLLHLESPFKLCKMAILQ